MRNKSHQPPFNEVVQFVLDASDVFLADREGILVVLNVYLDETGTHEDSPILGVGAFSLLVETKNCADHHEKF